jgi:hypothetical protein
MLLIILPNIVIPLICWNPIMYNYNIILTPFFLLLVNIFNIILSSLEDLFYLKCDCNITIDIWMLIFVFI